MEAAVDAQRLKLLVRMQSDKAGAPGTGAPAVA